MSLNAYELGLKVGMEKKGVSFDPRLVGGLAGAGLGGWLGSMWRSKKPKWRIVRDPKTGELVQVPVSPEEEEEGIPNWLIGALAGGGLGLAGGQALKYRGEYAKKLKELYESDVPVKARDKPEQQYQRIWSTQFKPTGEGKPETYTYRVPKTRTGFISEFDPFFKKEVERIKAVGFKDPRHAVTELAKTIHDWRQAYRKQRQTPVLSPFEGGEITSE